MSAEWAAGVVLAAGFLVGVVLLIAGVRAVRQWVFWCLMLLGIGATMAAAFLAAAVYEAAL